VASGDHERAVKLHEESLALARVAEDGVAMILSLMMGAFACLGQGDDRRAEALCRESLALTQQPRVLNAAALQLCASAALAGSRGLPARSARLWGAAQSLRESIGATLSPVEQRVYEPYIDAARARIDESAWEESWAEGEAMTLEEAVSYALADGQRTSRPLWRPTRETPQTGGQQLDTLTRRQREVALLVARGLTNRQISEELSISERTVTTHVEHILSRLGASSRTQVAARMAEQERLP
jgi:DNA-binding CsgD family transcriptional regulator